MRTLLFQISRLVIIFYVLHPALVGADTVCFSSAGQRANLPGCIYLGAGAGISRLEVDDKDSSFEITDKTLNSYKIHLGFYLTPKWFTELSYQSLGTLKLEERNPAQADTSEIAYSSSNVSLNYLFYNPDNRFNFYARAGYNAINLKAKGNLKVIKQPDAQLSLGLGLHWQMTDHWFSRAEFDSFATNAQQANLSISYLFGKAAPKKTSETRSQAKKTEVVQALEIIQPPGKVKVDKDTDQDGVIDSLDKCGGTLKGALVDTAGCTLELKQNREFNLQINFASGSSLIPDRNIPAIRRLAEFLTQYPYTSVEIAGHTDSQGSDKVNQRISQARADSVKEKLVLRFGIDAQRISTIGYGERFPVASNSTSAGRSKNRRVIAIVSPE